MFAMGSQDAAHWATILGVAVASLVSLCGFIYWLTLIHLDGRATRRMVGQLEIRTRKQGAYMRRRGRKSDLIHAHYDERMGQLEKRVDAIEPLVIPRGGGE